MYLSIYMAHVLICSCCEESSGGSDSTELSYSSNHGRHFEIHCALKKGCETLNSNKPDKSSCEEVV